jgi:molybdopterin-containing oxidoreductase family iron-sulfur binding subunit
MDKERRVLLKGTALLAAGAACGFPLLRAGAGAFGSSGPAPKSKQWAMVVDIQKCLDENVQRACIEACHGEHNVPTKISDPKREGKWLWTEDYKNAFPERQHPFDLRNGTDVLVLCNHCGEPACTKVCPTQATWKRKQDGVVMMDMHRCIGCRYCMAACPYGARSFNWMDPKDHIKGGPKPPYPTRSKGVVEKCTFCAERIRKGGDPTPACVEAAEKVPGGEGALTFGDLSDKNSDVRRILRQKNTICRRASVGTGPNVFYIV